MTDIKELLKGIYETETPIYLETRNVEYLTLYFAYTIISKLDKKQQDQIIKLVNESTGLTDKAKEVFNKELNTWIEKLNTQI